MTAPGPCRNIGRTRFSRPKIERDIYHRPDTLEEALVHLRDGAPRIAAGCTDLFPATERKALPGPILDITAIPELRGIARSPTGLSIGAATTWADLLTTDLPPAFDGLKAAASEVGARQIQARGTLAGNLCNASPAADGVPPLLTLDAMVELRSATATRRLPLDKFITGPRQTDRAEDELLTQIHIPAEALEGEGHFLKLGARKYLVISIAMVAARLTVNDGIVQSAALAIGACSPVATRLAEAEAALTGAPLDTSRITPDLIAPHLAPIADARADAAYRAQAATELVRRILRRHRQDRAA